jgi:hypothetical protein
MQSILVHGQQIDHLYYKDQPVVTFEQMARVHRITQKNLERSFRQHQTRFHEGKHCYLLDFAEASQLLSSIGAKANPYGLGIFTEAGYLLLVKPLRDDLAWQVQERMIEAYFRDKQAQVLVPADRALVVELATLMGIGHKELASEIARVERNTQTGRVEDQRTNEARFTAQAEQIKALKQQQARKDEQIETLQKQIDSMATAAAGPSVPSTGMLVNTVKDYTRNRLEILGHRPTLALKVYWSSCEAYMREHYVCYTQCGEAVYLQEDLREAYDTPGFGSRENGHLAGDERLQAEVQSLIDYFDKIKGKQPGFPRAVPRPRTYKPPEQTG